MSRASSDDLLSACDIELEWALAATRFNLKSTLDDIVDQPFADMKQPAVMHLLFHMHPVTCGQSLYLAFASPYVCDELLQQNLRQKLTVCKTCLMETEGGVCAALRGQVFDTSSTSTRSTFDIRNLKTNGENTINISATVCKLTVFAHTAPVETIER